MAKPLSRTQSDDAPLSSAKNPDARMEATGPADAADQVVGRTVTINRPRHELYAFWRDFSNLPKFMHDIQSITPVDSMTSHWVVSAPAGQTVAWDATVVEDRPDELIAWMSNDNASVRNSGRVEFKDAQAGRGTLVTATIVYDPPAGAIGKLIAKLYQKEPKIQARRELRRFKQLMETGEVSTAEPPDAAPRA